MALKPHLLFNKAPEANANFKYGIRYPSNSKDKEEEEEINEYPEKVKVFEKSIRDFKHEYSKRQEERIKDAPVPQEIISIELHFHGLFKANDFEKSYLSDFGLAPLKYFDFNTKGLFTVIDKIAFKSFWLNLRNFVKCENHNTPNYNRNLLFIENFKLHTTTDRLQRYTQPEYAIYFEMIDSALMDYDFIKPTTNSLKQYLNENKIEFIFNEEIQSFEIPKVPRELIEIIARNFDAIHSVNSFRHTITYPNKFGLNMKGYPFKIFAHNNIPTIGIIDTGISSETPLSSIIINKDNTFAINGMNPLVDEADGGYGHGTSVAALAALGGKLSNGFEAEIYADAMVLSMKILGESSGNIINTDVLSLIKTVCEDPSLNIKLFTLTINYESHLESNDNISEYAYQLDKLAFDYDILIFISTANQGSELDWNNLDAEYPDHFKKSCSNLKSPSESMNNMTIGAIGDNFEDQKLTNSELPLSSADEPAVYTRKYHLDSKRMKKPNPKLIKPDVVFAGGNFSLQRWDFNNSWIVEPAGSSALKVLSANKNDIIIKQTGTSLSTPLIANLAAKILNKYPTLKPQTVKALIINSSKKVSKNKKFDSFTNSEFNCLVGHGVPNSEKCLFSDENSATLILEDQININRCRNFTLQIPDYFNTVEQEKSLLKFEVTLCYNFKPINNNQIAYCPVNINFGIFKNVPLERSHKTKDKAGRNRTVYTGITGASKSSFAFKEGWSQYQDGMDRSKMLSNVQKMNFTAKREDIINENNCFKLAIGSHFHKILPDFVTETLPNEYSFSLVIRVSDNQKKSCLEGKLYNKIKLINDLEIIPSAIIEGDLEAEL
ncbi:S8 family peptidase [Labilibaculum sp. K2S]|uniref:S8 family peptidase n=1 Tax=Labilibaculum sp. K2S TaxID=3056386 RepID=UPI0025A3F977|nr:S8 family peptidase [Labilibaculum sp. K2S]MDM8159166.1 S8 family peptidase [Labilibaculum sp. K2S]